MKILSKLLVLILLVVAFGSCRKYNQIDNGSTVKTPYTLFIGGYNGILKKTNDALYFGSLFYTDNSTVRSIVVADSNICYVKDKFYYSKDDGKFFLPSFTNVIKPIDSFNKYFIPNITLYDNINKRLYLCAEKNVIQYSTDLGKTFTPDASWSAASINSTSITQTSNGDLYTIASDSLVYKRTGTNNWNLVVVDTPFNLPQATWYLSHSSDTLMAIDYKGKEGVYYSTDGGVRWYTGKQLLPNTQEILFGNQVFGQFYIGLDSGGLYRFSGNQFTPVGKGIPWYAKVSNIIGKTVRYRTDAIRNYWFCSTDQGLYISETDGTDWKIVLPGQYSTLR